LTRHVEIFFDPKGKKIEKLGIFERKFSIPKTKAKTADPTQPKQQKIALTWLKNH